MQISNFRQQTSIELGRVELVVDEKPQLAVCAQPHHLSVDPKEHSFVVELCSCLDALKGYEFSSK